MKINCGFIIVTPIISNVKGLIIALSKNSIFNLVICFDIKVISKSKNNIKNDFDNIENLQIISAKEFSELKKFYIFSNTPYFDFIKNIDIKKLLVNNKFLNVSYACHIHKQLYNIIYNSLDYNNFYATFHECPENYNDFISYYLKNNKNFDVSSAHLSGSTKIQYLKNSSILKKLFNNENKTILFSFRWETCTNNYTGDKYMNYFLTFIKQNLNINFIYRPHPLSDYQKLLKFENENYYVDYENDSKNAFDSSDILISDLSTLISDYFIYTKKPVILMKSENLLDDILNSFGKKIIEGIYVINDENELNKNLILLLNNTDEKKDIREQIASELDIYDANNYIIEFMKNDFHNKSVDNLNNQYWNIFYKKNNITEVNKPSNFAEFIVEYLKKNDIIGEQIAAGTNKNNKLLEFGCGNGRDLILFKKYFNVVGLDTSIQVKQLLKEKNIDVIIDSMTLFHDYSYDLYYSRFSLHAINIDEINIFLLNIKNMKPNSLFFIETRSIKGSKFQNNDYYECDFKSTIGDSHKRTLLNIRYIKNKIVDSFEIIYEADTNNVAIYKNENPYVIRLILKKK
jgi:SAM-dependent methyltransferase